MEVVLNLWYICNFRLVHFIYASISVLVMRLSHVFSDLDMVYTRLRHNLVLLETF